MILFPKTAQQKLAETLGFANKFQDSLLDVIKTAEDDKLQADNKIAKDKKKLEDAQVAFRVQETNYKMEVIGIGEAKGKAEVILQNIKMMVSTYIKKEEV